MDGIEVFTETIKILLEIMEQKHGELKLFSSRATEETSRAIDEIIYTITDFLSQNPRFGMYNIQLFKKDSNLETKHIISTSAKCYNCFLLNTNFPSQHLLKNNIILGTIVNFWPTLSPYLFIQIIWHLKCEDLLVESLVHIPLDLCLQILEIIIKHIYELKFSGARRLVFLLIYKVYYKCLWLHIGTLSEQNVIKHISQLRIYVKILLDFLINSKFVTSCALSIKEKHLQHGILIKNMLYYIKKCMHSKIESFLENHNLAKLFILTYGNSNESTNNYRMLLAKEIKFIITKLDQQLITMLLNQIKHVDSSEFITWGNIDDDENTMISLQRAIIIECHYFMEFMKQNKFLATNKDLFHYLQQLVGSRKPEESILTLQELCHNIARGRPNSMKELIKRYKEWDLSILDFINERIKLLRISDVFVILEYLHHKFTYLRTKAEKYKVYVSVLKILTQLTIEDMHSTIENYVKLHLDDNPLEYLYSEERFAEFIEGSSFDEFHEEESSFDESQLNELITFQELRTILIFILLNPRKVLSKLVMYEISTEFNDLHIFSRMSLVRSYYSLNRRSCNLLMCILKDIIFQQRVVCSIGFQIFMDNVINYYKIITADDIMNEIYIAYLVGSYFEETTIFTILSHMYSILERRIFTNKTNFTKLIIALSKTASLLRHNASFSKSTVYERIELINNILLLLRLWNILTDEKSEIIYFHFGINIDPLDMNKLWPTINTLHIIREYERRCFVMHRRLRTDRRYHPKLRNFVQSFTLDREAFIRHMILHSLEAEHSKCVTELMVTFYYFGWADKMIAFENLMRITAEASQIALMYIEMFPKNTFVELIQDIVCFCNWTASEFYNDEDLRKFRHILLKTLSSMNHVVSRTHYGIIFNLLLLYIQDVDPYLNMAEYFTKINEWLKVHMHNFLPSVMHIANKDCTCTSLNNNLNCTNNIFIEKKIAVMYNTYLFIRECSKLQYIERFCDFKWLLRNLCLTE